LPHLAPVEHVRRAPDGVTLGVSVRGERAVRLWHLDRLWSNLNDLDLGQGLPTLPTPRPLTKPFPRRDKTKPPIDRFLTGDTKHLPVDSPHGLRVDYFGNPDLSGRPVVSGLVANIDFDWGSKQPTTEVPANHFSVRWTGTLTAPQPGQYDLQVYVDDWARLWIDDTLVIDAWDRPVGVHGCTVNLTGQPQRIRLDYAEITGFAECHLSWRPHGTKAFSIIPTPAFSPR
jgi:hypothetical protein